MSKKHLSIFLLASALLAQVGIAKANEVSIRAVKTHIPKGFDANDEVEITVTGFLPDTCYLRPTAEAKIVGRRIAVEMKATRVVGMNCIQAIVPYMVSLPLGQLTEGRYTVAINADQKNERTDMLDISRPNSDSIDNFTYANVSNIRKTENVGHIILEGTHPSSCMKINRVEIVPNDKGDTLAILPIVEQIYEVCDRAATPFSHEIVIPTTSSQSDMILHVRRIDGRAFNFKFL